MRLTFVEVRDFRSIFVDDGGAPLRLDLAPGANTLVGQNNCGKSNVLRAISMALDPNHEFDPERDTPGPRPFSHPIITLGFHGERADPVQAAVLDAADAYERLADPHVVRTRAADGDVVLQVSFVPTADGVRRDETLVTSKDQHTPSDVETEALALVLERLRSAVRFVLISSGESIESVLEGNFREILHSVVRDRLKAEFATAEQARTDYIIGLQDSLLRPLRDRLSTDVRGLFPEIESIRLAPDVSSIERMLSNVGVSVEDIVATPLADKGTGVRGGVLVAMLSYLALNATRGMVFALEEPEAFLHPAAQENLRDSLETLAASDGVTLLVTTHSPFIVTRSDTGRVFCLAKDHDGRTRVSESAPGDADHAPLIGGLLRQISMETLLASVSAVPSGTEAVVLVEGDGDRFCFNLAAQVIGRPDLLDGLCFRPTSGTVAMIAQAVIAKAAVEVPLLVVVDNDEPGQHARKTLVGHTFGFGKKQVLTYASVFPQHWNQFPVEAEDLFEPALIARFAELHGAAFVDGTKKRPDDQYHYDFGVVAKEALTAFLAAETTPADVVRWIEMLLLLRAEAGLSVPAESAAELVAAAPTRPVEPPVEDGFVFVVPGAHDFSRYAATGALLLPPEQPLPPEATRIGFYQGGINLHLPAIVADHPNLLFDPATVRQLRATGKPGDEAVAGVIADMLDRDHELTGRAMRVVLLSSPEDPQTIQLDGPVTNTKTINGKPVAWTIGPKLVPIAAFADSPATTEILDEAVSAIGAS